MSRVRHRPPSQRDAELVPRPKYETPQSDLPAPPPAPSADPESPLGGAREYVPGSARGLDKLTVTPR